MRLFAPSQVRHEYLLVLHESGLLSPLEVRRLADEVGGSDGTPIVEARSIAVNGPMPTGANAYVVALVRMACEDWGIDFDPERDTISFRTFEDAAIGQLGLVTIGVRHT